MYFPDSVGYLNAIRRINALQFRIEEVSGLRDLRPQTKALLSVGPARGSNTWREHYRTQTKGSLPNSDRLVCDQLVKP